MSDSPGFRRHRQEGSVRAHLAGAPRRGRHRRRHRGRARRARRGRHARLPGGGAPARRGPHRLRRGRSPRRRARATPRSPGQAHHHGHRAGPGRRRRRRRRAGRAGRRRGRLRVREHRGLHGLHAARVRQGRPLRQPGRLPQPGALVAGRACVHLPGAARSGALHVRPRGVGRERRDHRGGPHRRRRGRRARRRERRGVEPGDRALPRADLLRHHRPRPPQRGRRRRPSRGRGDRGPPRRDHPRAGRLVGGRGAGERAAPSLAGAPPPLAPGRSAVFVGRDDDRARAALEGSPGPRCRATPWQRARAITRGPAPSRPRPPSPRWRPATSTACSWWGRRRIAATRRSSSGGRRPCEPWPSRLLRRSRAVRPRPLRSPRIQGPPSRSGGRALHVLDRLRRSAAVASTRRLALELREPHTGRVLAARGAVAVLPPRALRMILLGPGGTTALDLWASGDRYRFAVPVIDLKKRGDLGGPPEERRGLPVDFLTFWLLRPASGRLLWHAREAAADRFVLRGDGAAVVDLRAFDDGRIDVRRATWSSGGGRRAPPPPGRGDRDGRPARLRHRALRASSSTGLSRDRAPARTRRRGDPPARALVDPDAEVSP